MKKTHDNHSSVNYVEPNDVNMMEVKDSNGVVHYIERAPKLEDFCIALGLEVELAFRNVDVVLNADDKKLTMIYSGTKGGNRINFYKGSVLGNNKSASFLTSYYADMTSEDIKSFETTEMLGIKSINVEYDNFCVPQITIVFTDVRGMSLFQPSENYSEMKHSLESVGFSELNSKNVSNAFFRSFFLIPCPKFTIYLKGFYGEPVAYEMTCVDFRTSFDAEHGDFDVTVKFVGYTFSFLTEVSVNALIAAPYSDYLGEEYWRKNIDNGRFALESNKNPNAKTSMPTLCELVTDIYNAISESSVEIGESDLLTPFRDNTQEITELKEILSLYSKWYAEIFSALATCYGESTTKPLAVTFNSQSIEYYDFGVFFVPASYKNKINNLSDVFSQISGKNSVSNAHIALRAKVDVYNANTSHALTLTQVSEDLSEFTRQKYISKIIRKDENQTYSYSKILDSNSIFTQSDIDTYKYIDMLSTTTTRLDSPWILENGYKLRDINSDDTSLDVIKVDLKCKEIANRIKYLSIEYSEEEKNERDEKIADLQRDFIMKKLSWYPSIENFTKIMMAHLETLMYMMFKTVEATIDPKTKKSRTASDLGVTIGSSGDCSDVVVTSAATVPPFPRVVKTRTEIGQAKETIEVKEDAWIGEFARGKGFVEADLVNGLLNGAEKVNKRISSKYDAEREANRNIAQDSNICVIPFPITSYDYYLKENPYGQENDIVNNFAAFAAKVALRMYGVLAINHYTVEFDDFLSEENVMSLGSIEADNFYEGKRLTNSNLIHAITSNTFTSTDILNIVSGRDNKYAENGKWPWSDSVETSLFENQYFYPQFETTKGNIFPLQGFNFSNINEKLSMYSQNQLSLSEYRNIATPLLPLDNSVDMMSYAFNDLELYFNYDAIIDDNLGMINSCLAAGASNQNVQNKDYYNLSQEIFKKVSSEGVGEGSDDKNGLGQTFASFFKEEGKSSFCGVHGISNLMDYGSRIFFSVSPNRECRVAEYTPSLVDLYEICSNKPYVHDSISLCGYTLSEKISNNITSVFLTEVFGMGEHNDWALFSDKDYYTLGDWDENCFTSKYVKASYFVLCLWGIDYDKVYEYIKKRTHFYLPKVITLQMGAIFAAQYYLNNKSFTNSANNIKEKIPLPKGLTTSSKFFKHIIGFSKSAKLQFIKSFRKWADDVTDKLKDFELNFRETPWSDEDVKKYIPTDNKKSMQFKTSNLWWIPKTSAYAGAFLDNTDYNSYGNNDPYDPLANIMRSATSNSSTYSDYYVNNRRLLLNEENPSVRYISNSLLRVVCVTRGHDFNDSSDYTGNKVKRKLDVNKAKIYLDSFLKRLSDRINGITGSSNDESSNIIHRAKTPTQVTIDMKISLYLYLKQLYDKWLPSTQLEDWKFDTFFEGASRNEGHKFHFIDSFYNKIGQKLPINPEKISNALEKAMLSPDWNATMLPFMSDIYAMHKCMFKCIQNFIDVTSKDSMDNMFKPISYYEMKEPKRYPDFVVIYPYQPSSNLDMKNGGFEDDSFMLNDKEKSPSAIVTRTLSTKGENDWYQLPAFGVVYGGQYQSYFKRIDINMDNPIATEQSIGAKYRIAQMNRTDSKKTVMTTAQDLYDIYSNRSYTCKIQMMGCAWVQPLMYFVLLNVPMFKGSYMIMKVSHKITPGNMETEILGCRMCRVATKLVTDIFTDEGGRIGGNFVDNFKYTIADATNDCPYEIFPLHNTYDSEINVSADLLERGYSMMQYLKSKGFNEIPAIASVGCMYGESGLEYTKINPNDLGYISGSLCQWRAGNLVALASGNAPDASKFWCTKNSEVVSTTTANTTNANYWEKRLKEHRTIEQVLDFYYETFTNRSNCYPKDRFNIFNSKTDLISAVEWWYDKYGVGAGAGNPADSFRKKSIGIKLGFAEKLRQYCSQHGTTVVTTQKQTKEEENFNILLCKAVGKTFAKCTKDGNLVYNEINGTFNKAQVKFIEFKETSGKNKLYKVFDILLNGYCEYVQTLEWVYDENNVGGDPEKLVVYAREKEEVQQNFRQISIRSKGSNTNDSTEPPEGLNPNFYKSLMKRYGGSPKPSKNSGDNLVKMTYKESGEYIDIVKKAMNEIAIESCSTLLSGLPSLQNFGNNSSWINAVQSMGKWYEANIHTYHLTGIPYKCPLTNGEVYDNCSGYVSACLQYFGTFKVGERFPSAEFTTSSKVADKLEAGGFKKLDYSWDIVQPYDIVSYCGHVEILAEKSNHPKSWGWGAIHDNNYNGDGKYGMPAPSRKDPLNMDNKPIPQDCETKLYRVIWRYMG